MGPYKWPKSGGFNVELTASLIDHMEVWKALNLLKQLHAPEWSQSTGESMWEWRLAMRDRVRWQDVHKN